MDSISNKQTTKPTMPKQIKPKVPLEKYPSLYLAVEGEKNKIYLKSNHSFLLSDSSIFQEENCEVRINYLNALSNLSSNKQLIKNLLLQSNAFAAINYPFYLEWIPYSASDLYLSED